MIESNIFGCEGCFERHDIVCIQTINDFGGHAMNHKKIAKQLMEVNKTTLDNTFATMTMPQDNPEKIFFRFVDKNPLFPDNSKDAIREYILASHKRRSDFKLHCDEGYEKVTNYLICNHLHHRDK